MTDRHPLFFMMPGRSRAILLPLIFCCWICGTALTVSATESVGFSGLLQPSNVTPHFYVRGYTVEGILLSTNILTPLFSKYTGTNVSLEEIVKAASDLQSAYRDQGYPAMSVAFVPEQIYRRHRHVQCCANGDSPDCGGGRALPQFQQRPGNCLPAAGRRPETARCAGHPGCFPDAHQHGSAGGQRCNEASLSTKRWLTRLAALHLKMDELEIQASDTRVHVVSTNAGPRFEVEKYLVNGNTILPSAAIGQAITNIDGAFGTNVGFDGIETVVAELGKAYHERGYVTVAVNVPQQKLTNATVKLQVLEGRLADIKVAGNRYFSSNNVMRALPSLHTNMVLNGPIFNAELNRANANQDRQIYPVISPGPGTGHQRTHPQRQGPSAAPRQAGIRQSKFARDTGYAREHFGRL